MELSVWCFFLLSTVLARFVRKVLERGVCQKLVVALVMELDYMEGGSILTSNGPHANNL